MYPLIYNIEKYRANLRISRVIYCNTYYFLGYFIIYGCYKFTTICKYYVCNTYIEDLTPKINCIYLYTFI